jgi:hypothetical protein
MKNRIEEDSIMQEPINSFDDLEFDELKYCLSQPRDLDSDDHTSLFHDVDIVCE